MSGPTVPPPHHLLVGDAINEQPPLTKQVAELFLLYKLKITEKSL